jgi:hypothetical protein
VAKKAIATSAAPTDDVQEQPLTKTQQRALTQARKSLTRDLDAFLSQELSCPPKEFIDDDWRVFMFGDVNTRALVDVLGDDVVLRVEAPIMRLPADKSRIAGLMRELLEFNFFCVGHARVAITGREVVAVTMQSATQIGKDDVPMCLRDTATLASLLIDGLQKTSAKPTKTRGVVATKRR